MVAYLTKSDASEGFTQIIDFLNGSYIKYALTMNLNIYVSCIKQFWTTVAIKQVNDVTRLQALVDKKKVVVTDVAIKEVLHLDDAEGVDCLPNEEIFTELARIGYEKPSTKLMFYKAFFLSQWKFLIHTILQSMSAKRTSWNEFSSSMASVVICLSTARKFNFSKYIFNSLIKEEGDADEHVKDVIAGDDAHGDDTAAHGEVPTVTQEPSIPYPTPSTPPPQPPQDLPSTSWAADFPMSLLQEALDACVALIKRVEHLEYDKVAQALEITKLKRRVKKLEKGNKGMMIAKMDKDDVVVLIYDKEEDKKKKERSDDDVYTEATPLARKVPVVDYEIIEINNKPYYKIIRADGTHQLYISFLTLLKNFDREDLEALWNLVKERFSTSNPKNFSDDFLLTTLGAMFEKPDAHAKSRRIKELYMVKQRSRARSY
nr:hypothetical protein [Tanacetum cinerariifolium]